MARAEDSDPKEPAKRNGRPVIEIREMEIDDLAAVFHLGEELFTAREVPNLYRTWDDYEVVGSFQSDPELCLVAEDDETGDIVGFALGTTIEKTKSAWKYGHLVWLGVHPDYQRFGVGYRLVNQLKSRMTERGVRIILVDTEADNLAALRFFRNLGFGSPQEHIYLSLNLETYKKRNGERANSKNHRH